MLCNQFAASKFNHFQKLEKHFALPRFSASPRTIDLNRLNSKSFSADSLLEFARCSIIYFCQINSGLWNWCSQRRWLPKYTRFYASFSVRLASPRYNFRRKMLWPEHLLALSLSHSLFCSGWCWLWWYWYGFLVIQPGNDMPIKLFTNSNTRY